jgi:soluble lytic murein transglycosylase-like protein
MDAAALHCVAAAAKRWEVPELLIHSIVAKEGGKPGAWRKNRNGTFDLGPAQINTATWRDYLAPYGITIAELANDTCVNVQAATYVLKNYQLKMGGDWYRAVMAYHIGPNRWERRSDLSRGHSYAAGVFSIWKSLADYAERYAARYTGSFTTENNNEPTYRFDYYRCAHHAHAGHGHGRQC